MSNPITTRSVSEGLSTRTSDTKVAGTLRVPSATTETSDATAHGMCLLPSQPTAHGKCLPLFDPNHLENGSLFTELDRIGADCVDPIALLEEAFESCCKHGNVSCGAIWARLPSGDIAKIHDRQWPSEEIDSAGASLDSCLERVKESFLMQEATTVPFGTVNSDSCDSSMVLLPIRAQGEVRSVLTFAWNEFLFANGESQQLSWDAVQVHIELQLADSIERMRAHRKHKVAGRLRVPSATRSVSEGPLPSVSDFKVAGTFHVPSTSIDNPEATALGECLLLSDTSNIEPAPTALPPPAETIDTIDSLVAQQTRLLELARGIGQHLDPTLVAYDVANELRAYFGDGRIGVCYCKGSHCKLAALSGSESFDRRSSVVQAIESLVKPVAKIGQAVWHPEQQALPESLIARFDRYYEVTDARSIAILPIHAARADVSPDTLSAATHDVNSRDGTVIAIVTIEGLRGAMERETISEMWSTAEPLVANALQNSVRHSRILLLPFWLAAGDFFGLFRGNHRNKVITVVAIGIATMLALALLPSPIKLRANGTIQPVQRSRIYCEIPGTVERLNVEDGMVVAKGTPLMELSNATLNLECERVQGEFQETNESLTSIRNHLNSNRILDEQSVRSFRKEKASLEARLQSLENQKELLQQKRNKLQIASPIDGRVVTWDIHKRLANRPIEAGQHLLTVANSEGPWELELRVPDRLTGYLRNAAQSNDPNTPVAVQFVLASSPSKTCNGTLRRIADSSALTEDEGSVLRVYVDVTCDDREWLSNVRPGTEVIAHIHVDRGSLGRSLSFEFMDWIRRLRFRYLW